MEETSQSTSDTSDSTPWGWIVAAIVALAAIAGGAVWWIQRRRAQDGNPPDSIGDPPDSSGAPADSNGGGL